MPAIVHTTADTDSESSLSVEGARTFLGGSAPSFPQTKMKAIAFYERCGFAEESAHTDEATGLEAVIMVMTTGSK